MTTAVTTLLSCAGPQVHVSDGVSPAFTDQQEALRHCDLQGVNPIGSAEVAILCVGGESWLARGRGSKLELSRVHPFANGAGDSQGYLRGGKVEAVRRLPQRIRQISVDDRGKVRMRDWPVGSGRLRAAAAGPGGGVRLLLMYGDNSCYVNDIRTPEKAAGRVVSWSKHCAGGIFREAGTGGPRLWLETERGIELGSPEAATDWVPIRWAPSRSLLASTMDRQSMAFVLRDSTGIQVIRKGASGKWLTIHVGGTTTLAESTCAEDFPAFHKLPDHKLCETRGDSVEVAAVLSQESSLWLVLGTHRFERRVRQRIEGGMPAMRIRGDIVANQERVELSLVKLDLGGSSARSWVVAASESKALDCLDPNKAHHPLDDLKAVRLAIASNVVHVVAQTSERLLHFAVDVGRRRLGDKQLLLTKRVLNIPQEKDQDAVKDQKPPPVDAANEQAKVTPDPEPQKVARVFSCEQGRTRCGKRRCADLRTDVAHCGACGHRCLSGRCERGKCAPICHRHSDCNPGRAAVAGTSLNLVCSSRVEIRGNPRPPPRPSRCLPGRCGPDKICKVISSTISSCVPRTCRRTADCKTPGARCLSLPGQRKRQCLSPGHCMQLIPVP